MGVFKRRKQKSSDSQGSCSSGNSSGSNSSLEKKQQTPQSNPLKSSLHSSEGGSTSGYKTCQSGSYGTCRSRQSAQKNVRFSQVHVREYERSLGDNPSCSSGAPIGIGWGFVTALEMEVEEYERKHKRGRTQNEIILSRHEREALLKEWYTTEKEIIESTRETLKIKFQRRRSVRNALKMEYLSSFGKGLKKVLMRQRKSEELYLTTVPELSGLVTTGPPPITTTTAMEAEFPQVVEPENDEHNDSNDNNDDDDDDHHHPNPRASLLHNQSSSFDDMIDDATSAVSGITFGDSTTTSAYEMEMFHRELELEMFGEEPDELDESFSQQGRHHNNVVMEYNGSNNSMSIVSGSHEEEMSSSSSTMHSFQSPNNNSNNYYNDPQPRYNSPQMDNSPIGYSALQKQYEQQQQQMFLRQYNPYARTSAYRGYSLRDAYRNNHQFSAFDMANQMTQQQQSPTPNRLDVVEVTEPDDDDEDEFVMGPRQYHGGHNTTPHGPPHLIPPMYPSYNTNVVRYSSDDSRSWEEFYYERGSDGSSHYDSSMTNHSYMSMDYTARTDRTQHC